MMNKVHFLFLLTLVFLVSCKKEETNSVLESGNKPNSISVVIDDDLWNGDIGDSIRSTFAAPVLGLPQEEPIFTLNQFQSSLFSGINNNSRNLFVIKKENKSDFRIEENEYAKPQIVVHASGKTLQEVMDTIQKNDSLIIQAFKKSELKIFQNILKASGTKSTDIKEKFNLLLTLTPKYNLVSKGKNFLWFKKELPSGNLSLTCYQIPLSSIKEDQDFNTQIIKIRDSIGSKYIHGAVANTKMITETSYSPFVSKIKIAGRDTYETHGSWDLLHDFMSGPFVNYCILDPKNNRIIVLEGFLYAPSIQKRDLMFELEALCKSVQFLKFKNGK